MRMRSLLVGLAVLAILLVVVGWLDRPGPAGATRDSPGPDRLSVTVDNGRTRATEGDVLTYTTRVRNDEPRPHQLEVTQMLPAALQVVSANSAGRANAREVEWDVTLAAGEERALRATVEVGASRGGYDQLATTSCAGPPGQPPSTCAQDTDPLTVTSTAAPNTGRLLLASGIALILVLGVVAVYVVGNENSAPRPATGAAGAAGSGVAGVAGIAGTRGLARRAGYRPGGAAGNGRRVRKRGRRAGSRKGAAVPARVAEPLRSWIARVSAMIATRCRATWPAPSWYVPVRYGKARSPPDLAEMLPFVY